MQQQSSSNSGERKSISIDLHRKSLRQRLEAYYSLVAPETLKDQPTWQSKFEQIYRKFGGNLEGEKKLAAKLAKKYGTAVRLLVATGQPTVPPPQNDPEDGPQRSESWYDLHPNEKSSKDVRLNSNSFDPRAALETPEAEMAAANPWIVDCPLLDTVAQFAFHLPEDDPLRRDKVVRQVASERKPPPGKKRRVLHPFDSIAQSFEVGPLSVLRRFQHKRVRVQVRYVNAIRGTLTGILLAFDKHMNMILRDVEEVYSPRPVDGESRSNVDAEKERQQLVSGCKIPDTDRQWGARTRKMKQLLVRGDHVVSVNRAEETVSTKMTAT